MFPKSFYGKDGDKKESGGARRKLPFPASPAMPSTSAASDQPAVTYDFSSITTGTKLTPRKINFFLGMLEEEEKEKEKEEEEDREVHEFSAFDSELDPDHVRSGVDDDDDDGDGKGSNGFFWGRDAGEGRGRGGLVVY